MLISEDWVIVLHNIKSNRRFILKQCHTIYDTVFNIVLKG